MALDLSDDEELGEFIYRTSQTAKLLREKKEKDDVEDEKMASIQDNATMVKVEVKAEDDISTDDGERSPDYVVSSVGYYDPVKSEETDDEDNNNTVNEDQHLPIKEESVKTHDVDVSTDDDNEIEEPERQRKSPRLLANNTAQPNASIQDNIDMQHITKKRKRGVEESNESIQKSARIECSVEGCSYKAADSGTCKTKHKGYNLCKEEGCTNQSKKGGVCYIHGAKVKRKTCNHEGCTNGAIRKGVCQRHGAKRKTCKHEGCTNNVIQGGVCIKHGAVVKTCKHEGCSKHSKKGGVCVKHGAVLKTCSHEGCTNKTVQKGVCVKHGAVVQKRKTCSYDGCTKQAKIGGVCIKHGAKKRICREEGCTKVAQKGGVCIRHGSTCS